MRNPFSPSKAFEGLEKIESYLPLDGPDVPDGLQCKGSPMPVGRRPFDTSVLSARSKSRKSKKELDMGDSAVSLDQSSSGRDRGSVSGISRTETIRNENERLMVMALKVGLKKQLVPG